MTRKVEYDFLAWTSFPSSLKLFSDEPDPSAWINAPRLPVISVSSGGKLRVEVMLKQENVAYARSHIGAYQSDAEGNRVGDWLVFILVPYGTFDWKKITGELTIPNGWTQIVVGLVGGSGTPTTPGVTWFDDLKIYQDDVLIYDNYFTALRPGKVVPNVVTPPEIIVGMVQRFKAGRAGEELRVPLAIASV